jgi:hypothetical protein
MPHALPFALCFLLLSLYLSGCTQHPIKEVTRGVYFWKTNFSLNKEEINWIKKNDIRKIYLRFFDVDWNPQINAALPVGDVSIITRDYSETEIIPVIFITNRTFRNIPDSLIPELTANIHKKIFNKLSLFNVKAIREIQMDCDWTKLTKDKYFRLLGLLQELCRSKKIDITATIRLHQVKFSRETGVPPVKAGALMFYNMSDVSNIRTINSIFDAHIAGSYLSNFSSYQLHLDVILPAFSWGCVFRKSELKNLINGLSDSSLTHNENFIRVVENFYCVRRDCRLNGINLSKGDYLRIEHIDPGITLKAAKMLSPHLSDNSFTVSLYNFNDELINNYGNEDVAKIFSAFN